MSRPSSEFLHRFKCVGHVLCETGTEKIPGCVPISCPVSHAPVGAVGKHFSASSVFISLLKIRKPFHVAWSLGTIKHGPCLERTLPLSSSQEQPT